MNRDISASAFVTPDYRDRADRLICAIGHAPYDHAIDEPQPSFVVPLSKNGEAPATHYALHAFVDQAFIDLFDTGATGVLPKHPQPGREWRDFGLTEDAAPRVLAAITLRTVADATGPDSWRSALKEFDLQRVDQKARMWP